jgi:hypothetical protein
MSADGDSVGASQRAPASEEQTKRGAEQNSAEGDSEGASQRAPASEEQTKRGAEQ